MSKVWVQSNFRDETRGKIISGVFKYPNMYIWTSNMYIKYSNMHILLYDGFRLFYFNFFNTFIDNIN